MAAGDGMAIEQFYRSYFARMYIQARRATRRDEAFCLDVVQEATLRVIRSIRKVDSEPQLLAWLKLVVQTTAFNHLRQEQRRRQRESSRAPAAAPEPACRETLDWLRAEISRLDPAIIRMLELRFENQWTLREIGERLGLSSGSVDGRLRRALRLLRDRGDLHGITDGT